MNEEQSLRDTASSEEQTSQENASSPENSTSELAQEAFSINSEFFSTDDEVSKEYKSLLESLVNENGVPKEKIEKMLGFIEKGAEHLEKFKTSYRAELLDEYNNDFLAKKEEDLNNWAYNPKNISSPAELDHLKSFATKRLSGILEKDCVNELLSSRPFLQFMKSEMDAYREKSPTIASRHHEKTVASVYGAKLREELLNTKY